MTADRASEPLPDRSGSVELTDDPARQHQWKREDGDIDIFAYEAGHHNGPVCVRCGDGFCRHCEPDCYRYVCPEAETAPDEEAPR